MEYTYKTQRAEDMNVVAENILESIPEQNSAVVILLYGTLGAGKTTFTQALARSLGVLQRVTSPTFAIMSSYQTVHPRFGRLVHIDAYRIEDESEAKILGLEDLYADSKNIICIEWPERIPSYIPEHAHAVHIEIVGEGREIILKNNA